MNEKRAEMQELGQKETDLYRRHSELEAELSRRIWKLQYDIRELEMTKRDLMLSQFAPVIRAPVPLQGHNSVDFQSTLQQSC